MTVVVRVVVVVVVVGVVVAVVHGKCISFGSFGWTRRGRRRGGWLLHW